MTDVGAYTQSLSFYGTFDQGGNVTERNEAVISEPFPGLFAGHRGGSWGQPMISMDAGRRVQGNPNIDANSVGFRVAFIPEPSTVILAAIGLVGLAAFGWRRRKR